MNGMFEGASAFNRDIGGWAVQSATDMRYMFYLASAFDQDLGWCVDDGVNLARRPRRRRWDTSGVTDMRYMFYRASAFDQDLGWCVDNGVDLTDAFDETPCEATSCGVTQGSCPP